MSAGYSNLLEVIQELQYSNRGITYISRHAEAYVPYSDLYDQAQGVLHCLQSNGMQPKDELIFQLDDNRSFIVVFWACILGGIIPVPITSGNNEEHRLKLMRVWDVLNHPYLVTTQETFDQLEHFADQNEAFTCLESMRISSIIMDQIVDTGGKGIIHHVLPEDIAL